MEFFNLKIIGTAMLLAVLIFSCGKETQSSTQGGGVFYVRATITPPLQFGKGSGVLPNMCGIQIFGVSSYKFWDGTNQTTNLSNIQCDEVSVTSGQNISTSFQLNTYYDKQCRNVILEGVQNGKVIKTYTYEIGETTCKDFYQQQQNFIMN